MGEIQDPERKNGWEVRIIPVLEKSLIQNFIFSVNFHLSKIWFSLIASSLIIMISDAISITRKKIFRDSRILLFK
ncbi:hypothetical protein AKJ66_04260 [candidate division MSBL1 archaeon SCGC-AAA259E22]|uniref:Uncharacterized protein n=2 Tax=candidate division MSBL1 TaxID=215777 RepID=A0A133VGW6_9EURY|nr:hypothetical protein AKJ66_04260 [candidate division MSBL1 archaeon SCGC-AAA259E22]KXB05681.1 hypothetical protein AKJ50_00140 [candidate division MSBL1 archaeon SCGC-AAA382A13]